MIKLEDLLLTAYCNVAIMYITARIKFTQNIRTLEDRR